MSEPPEVPVTAIGPAPSRSRRSRSWGEIAEACGMFGMTLVLVLCWFWIPLDLAVATGVMLAPLILLVILSFLPCCWYPGHYPPLSPPRLGRRWLVRPPGVPFWFAFPHALCALYYVGIGIILATDDRGLKWGLWGVIAIAVVGLGTAIALGRAFRTSPELEVNEERRELLWRPNAVWAWPATLPFDAVVDVRVVTGRWFRYDPPEEFYQPEITWRSGTGRVRTTRLPISADRDRVEEVVARLRAAVLGTPAEASAPDPDRM